MNFSVVIISYNGKPFLEKCLNAISRSEHQPKDIIVVDDNSDDGTGEMLEKNFNYVKYIRNESNLGPTAARNKGAKLASGDNIIFLDNDTIVNEATLGDLASFLEKHPNCGVVGAKIILQNGKNLRWNIGHKPNNFREAIGLFFGPVIKLFPKSKFLKDFSRLFSLNYWDHNKLIEPGWVIESCFAIRKDLFEKIGAFDEQFFMFYEGMDLCERVRAAGQKVYFYPKALALDFNTYTEPRPGTIWRFTSSRAIAARAKPCASPRFIS